MFLFIYALAEILLMFLYFLIVNIVVLYINHFVSSKTTELSLIQNREPLTDIVHHHIGEVDEYYLNITLFAQSVIFLFYFFKHCQHKLIMYLKVNCFVLLMFSLRVLTIISTQYPNARKCDNSYQYCGDMMFSGHSVIVLTQYLSMSTYLTIENSGNKEYKSSKHKNTKHKSNTKRIDVILTKKPISNTHLRFYKILNRLHLVLTITNLFLIVAVRLHYTNDVLISSYLSIITWKYIDIYSKLQKV